MREKEEGVLVPKPYRRGLSKKKRACAEKAGYIEGTLTPSAEGRTTIHRAKVLKRIPGPLSKRRDQRGQEQRRRRLRAPKREAEEHKSFGTNIKKGKDRRPSTGMTKFFH